MIGIYLGEQNSGKTLSMTYYAYKYFKEGYDVFCNYNLSFPHKKITKQTLTDYTKGQVQFNKTVFCIDEIYLIFDSRNFGRAFSKLFSYFVLQTSKRGCHLFGTAQFFNTVDKRFRENTNFLCYCQRQVKTKTGQYLPVANKLRFLKKNQELYIKNNFIIKGSLEGVFNHNQSKAYYLRAKPIFDLYDTTELLGVE